MFKPALGIAVIVLGTLLSGVAIGHGGGHHGGGHGGGHGFGRAHFGGGHHGGGRFAHSRSFSRSSFRGNRSFSRHGGPNSGQIRNAAVGRGSIRSAMNSLSRPGGLRNGRLLSNPVARALVAAGF